MESPPPLPAESASLDVPARPTATCPMQHRRSSILPGTPPGSDAHVPWASQSPLTPVTIPSLVSSDLRALTRLPLCFPCGPLCPLWFKLSPALLDLSKNLGEPSSAP